MRYVSIVSVLPRVDVGQHAHSLEKQKINYEMGSRHPGNPENGGKACSVSVCIITEKKKAYLWK